MENNQQKWTEVISSETSIFKLNLDEVWRYKDLLFMFVKRDFVTFYKQTILGPLWFIIQPLLTTIMYVIIFGNLAKISTDESPKIVFYLAGVSIWGYFSETLTKTASVFTTNANIFGKVYFPRLIMPLSLVVSGMIKFGVQFSIFIAVLLYYFFVQGNVYPNAYVLLTPFLLFLMAILALGLGMIISSMTTKYKDLSYLISFGIQLFMYATPVVYPLSSIPEKYKFILLLNPLTAIFECFRYAFLGTGAFEMSMLVYGTVVSIVILIMGIIVFNKVEKNFIDTV
ncbi:ABC transporter permease [Flavobacterium psychrotolerans]|uniref:Transport permease protein n=1 Tax=Flavobacterium psychrotolerans TaxID=2169410 RepID=A0A2U1JI85_9FLAO|nr:ABC transporter permease [Flavobacterium psychrotolerans]PWA04866.1 ABC transporter permease [Flavobacterium psychrotolerans]